MNDNCKTDRSQTTAKKTKQRNTASMVCIIVEMYYKRLHVNAAHLDKKNGLPTYKIEALLLI